jgi:cell pole-organizing protein PopZ
MEDILASIRRMIAQDQDALDAAKADREDTPLPENPASDDEVLDLIEEMPEDSMAIREAAADDAGAGWSAPPDADTGGFGKAGDPLALEAEFAIQEDQEIVLPDETAASPVEPAPWTEAGAARHPVMTVGLTDMMEPVAEGDFVESRIEDEPPESVAEADIDEPDDRIAEPIMGEPVARDEDAAPEPHEEVVSMDTPTERILSPEAAVKTSTAFDQLARTLLSGYEGDTNTLEGVVRAMLKPLLKEWLDTHLPKIVEDIVQTEIRRLSR